MAHWHLTHWTPLPHYLSTLFLSRAETIADTGYLLHSSPTAICLYLCPSTATDFSKVTHNHSFAKLRRWREVLNLQDLFVALKTGDSLSFYFLASVTLVSFSFCLFFCLFLKWYFPGPHFCPFILSLNTLPWMSLSISKVPTALLLHPKYISMLIHACVHTHTHTHTHIGAHKCASTHTYTHTHTQTHTP